MTFDLVPQSILIGFVIEQRNTPDLESCILACTQVPDCIVSVIYANLNVYIGMELTE